MPVTREARTPWRVRWNPPAQHTADRTAADEGTAVSPNLGRLGTAAESLVVLSGRDFRLLLSAQAVSVIGDRAVAVALAFAVLEVGGSASEVGLVLAAGGFPLVGSVLVGGVIADRASRRAVMVFADLVRVASQGTMAALLISAARGPSCD